MRCTVWLRSWNPCLGGLPWTLILETALKDSVHGRDRVEPVRRGRRAEQPEGRAILGQQVPRPLAVRSFFSLPGFLAALTGPAI